MVLSSLNAETQMIHIVGIDPGLAETGIGIVKGQGLNIYGYSFGNIHTLKSMPLAHRLNFIYSHIREILDKEKPDLIIVEDVFSLGKNPKSGILLGNVTGAVLLAGCHSSVPVTQVPVREVKKILTGNGNAGKEQLEKSVRHTLNHPQAIRPFHSADALALALIGLYRFDTFKRNGIK